MGHFLEFRRRLCKLTPRCSESPPVGRVGGPGHIQSVVYLPRRGLTACLMWAFTAMDEPNTGGGEGGSSEHATVCNSAEIHHTVWIIDAALVCLDLWALVQTRQNENSQLI